MKKRVLMVSLSMAMVIGLAGIVTAATSDNNTSDMQPETSNSQAYMNNSDVISTEVELGETTHKTVTSKTDVYDQMKSSNLTMNEQVENMPIDVQVENIPIATHMENMPTNTQMQNMPTYTQMNDQMNDSQHTPGMAGTNTLNDSNASQLPAQKSSGNNMMGSMGR